MFQDLPTQATPEGLHKICREIRGEQVPIEELSKGLPQGPKYIQQNVEYGILLGFIEEEESNDYQLTTRGLNLSYEDGISKSVRDLFYTGLLSSEEYSALLEKICEEVSYSTSIIEEDEVARILRVTYDVNLSEGKLSSLIKTFFKTLEAAGVGEFKLGRGDQNTRIELIGEIALADLLADHDESPPNPTIGNEVEDGFEDFDEVLRAKCLPVFYKALYQQAVMSAFVVLEDRVRAKGSFDYDDVGQDLMAMAFSEDDGPLAVGNIENEQEGFRFLYQGVYKSLRNPNHHHLESMDRQQAHDILSFINLLLTFIENQS